MRVEMGRYAGREEKVCVLRREGMWMEKERCGWRKKDVGGEGKGFLLRVDMWEEKGRLAVEEEDVCGLGNICFVQPANVSQIFE